MTAFDPKRTSSKGGSVIRTALLLGLLSVFHECLAAPCGAGTLQGQYVFTGRGFIEALEPGVQRMHYGVFIFDGRGAFVGKQSSSRGGKIGREKLQGIYTLDDDCSGTMTFNSILNPKAQIRWDIYITEDGKRGHMI